jgi:SMC interacting uncharacterized protein involved in chromosome segregation
MVGPDKMHEGASDLVKLSHEVDELEAGRASLLQRLDKARANLIEAGERTVSVRAVADMLRDHMRSSAIAAADLRAVNEEVRELGHTMTEVTAETLGMIFEADGLRDSLGEAEEEMERLLAILVTGKGRDAKGH